MGENTNFSERIFKKSTEIDPEEQNLKNEDFDPGEDDPVRLKTEHRNEINELIEKNERNIEKSLQELPENVKGVYLSVIVSFIFIAFAAMVNQVQNTSEIGIIVSGSYESVQWRSDGSTFATIASIDDLRDYIRLVAIPVSYGGMGDYNYFVGLRITLKRSISIRQPDSDYKGALPYVKENPIINLGINNADEETKRIGIWNYSTGYKDSGGYTIYILANETSEEEALEIWRAAEAIWLEPIQFSCLVIEYVYHNPNYQCTLYYHQDFQLKLGGWIDAKSEMIGAFIEEYEQISGISLAIVVLFVMFSLGLSLQIFKLAQNLMRTIKTLMAKRKLDMVWHEYIELLSVVFALVAVVLFISFVLSQIGKNKLPVTTSTELSAIINYCLNFKTFVQFLALAALLVSFKIIVVLRYKFPSFGVLFDTILMAKTHIINFMVITMFMLIGFVFMGCMQYGPKLLFFSTPIQSLRILFEMAVGPIHHKDEIQADNSSGIFFIVVYMTIFFLILVKVFIAIMMSTYEALKRQGQLILQAKAKMMAKESEKWFQTLIDLLLFRVKSMEDDAVDYEKLLSQNQEGITDKKKQEIDEKLKMYEAMILASTRIDLIKIFKTNFAKLTTLNSPSMLTHEQSLDGIKTTLREILEKEKINKLTEERQSRLVNYNFNMIMQMFIYMVFIAIFIVMITRRLSIPNSYAVHELITKVFSEQDFGNGLKLPDVASQDDVFAYLEEVFLPIISTPIIDNQNFFISENRARLCFQRYVLEPNPYHFSQDVIPYYIGRSGQYVANDFRGDKSKILYLYTDAGTKETFNEAGGFNFYLKDNTDMKTLIEFLRDDDILGIAGSYIVVEWVLYNANLNFFIYSYIQFSHSPSGQIVANLEITPIDLDFFRDPIPIAGILEIIYLLFNIYYIVLESREWCKILNEVRIKMKEKKQGSDALERVIIKILGQRNQQKGCTAIIEQAASIAKRWILWVYTWIRAIFQTTLKYFTKDAFNMIDVISIILCFLNLSQIFQLAINNFVRNFTVDTVDSYQYFGEFSAIQDILASYKIIVAFNCLMIFVRLLQFYKFSKRLSLLTMIFDSAKLDLIFFMLMFSIILFAYVLMGYLLLGHSLLAYSTLQRSFVSCYLIITGFIFSSTIYNADSIFGTIFLVTLIIVFMLILINMFIAIIVAHFKKVREEGEKEEGAGFIETIFRVIKAKMQGKVYLDELEQEERERKNSDKKAAADRKKWDDEIFHMELAPSEATNPVAWMKAVETVLLDKTDKTVSLFAMKVVAAIKDSQKKLGTNAQLNEICYLNKEIWKQIDIGEKLRMWRSIALINREFSLRKIEKAYLHGNEIPERISLDDYMEMLWEAMSKEEQLELWIGADHFNDVERVAIWNALKFQKSTFNAPADQSVLDYWETLSCKEKIKKVVQIVESNSVFIRKLKNTTSSKVKELLDFYEDGKDYKLVLWLALTYNDHWLRCLFLNLTNTLEAEIVAMLNIGLNYTSIFGIDAMDDNFEELLDGGIFDAIEAKANLLSEMQKDSHTASQIELSRRDIENLLEYKVVATEELAKLRRCNDELKEDYIRYVKK